MQFGLGLILGGVIGMIATAIMVAARDADDSMRRLEKEWEKDEW